MWNVGTTFRELILFFHHGIWDFFLGSLGLGDKQFYPLSHLPDPSPLTPNFSLKTRSQVHSPEPIYQKKSPKSQKLFSDLCAGVYMHVHTYTGMHAYTWAYTHIHWHTHTYTCMHTHTQAYTHIHWHTHTYTNMYTHTLACTHIHWHALHIHGHTHCLSQGFYSCTNIMTKKQDREERVYSAYSFHNAVHHQGSQDWNSNRSGSRS